MTTLKFPLEFDQNGSLVTLDADTDEFYAQLLSLSALTEPNTFPFSPTFGVMDPSFSSVNRGMFMFQAARFIPEIQVMEAEGELNESSGATVLRVKFRRI